MLQGFEQGCDVYAVVDAATGWPEGFYVDKESAEQAMKQLDPDGFYRVCYGTLDKYVGLGIKDNEVDWA